MKWQEIEVALKFCRSILKEQSCKMYLKSLNLNLKKTWVNFTDIIGSKAKTCGTWLKMHVVLFHQQ
jgi:hypothetical protein